LLHDKKLPDATTVWRYWRSFGDRLCKQRQPIEDKLPLAGVAHGVCQLDAKESVPVPGVGATTFNQARDEFGRLTVLHRIHPADKPDQRIVKLTCAQVQQDCRIAFTQWGLPHAIQTDRASIFVDADPTPFPTPLTLWWVGLGIEHRLRERHTPKRNGSVERSHRTLNERTLIGQQFSSAAALQDQVDVDWHELNAECPSRARSVSIPCETDLASILGALLVPWRRASHRRVADTGGTVKGRWRCSPLDGATRVGWSSAVRSAAGNNNAGRSLGSARRVDPYRRRWRTRMRRTAHEPFGMRLIRRIQHRLASCQHPLTLPVMHHRRGQQAERRMMMLVVIPRKERPRPGPRIRQTAKALRIGRMVFHGLKLRFGKRVVIRDVRPAMRFGDPQVTEQLGDTRDVIALPRSA